MVTISPRPKRVAFALVGLMTALSVVLTACGSPEFTYVQNSGEHTYFKVPADWREIDRAALDRVLAPEDPYSVAAQVRKKLVWSVAYDADPEPSPAHLFGASTQPFVYASVRRLADSERGAISFNTLRNFILPVTAEARQTAKEAGVTLQDFELIRDEVLTPGEGIRGVRAVFNYRHPSGSLQTFDQTAYVTDDASRVYFLLLRCSARCYRQRGEELDTVARSFTVRSPS
jgi:hypothetical protein